MRHLPKLLLIALCCTHLSAHAQIDSNMLAQKRVLFLAAEQALDKGDDKTYTDIHAKLKDYPLASYLEYKQTVKAIRQNSNKSKGLALSELKKNQAIFSGTPLWNQLLYRWLKIEARHARWQSFLEGYALRDKDFRNIGLNCSYHYAQYAQNADKNLLHGALDLWLVGKSQPHDCDILFGVMVKEKIIRKYHIVQRIFLSIEDRHYTLAKYLKSMLPASESNTINTWIKMAKRPELILEDKYLQAIQNAAYQEKIIQSVFYRFARKDVVQAKEGFDQIQPKLKISRHVESEIIQDIAIRLSHAKDIDAIAWLERIPKAYINTVAQEWRVRLALHQRDWPNVLENINHLDPLLALKPMWQYWKARAHMMTGNHQVGIKMLKDLSEFRSYYGFLASEHLKQPHQLRHVPLTIADQTIQSQKLASTLARVEELMMLNRIYSAKREWYYHMYDLSESDKLIAAKTAYDKGWYDLAIMTMSNADKKDDLNIRFPFGFQEHIAKHAEQNNLDPAWIFALTRQESAFSQKARSGVGAAGLMQLMPSTATYIAKKNKLPTPQMGHLLTPETNIQLGTIYLGALNQSLGGQVVLATASYNAGINRILRWLPHEAIDSDVWIENIPYRETRHYVKNVLTYMGIYKNLMGESFRLSSVMMPVKQFDQPIKTP